MNHRQKKEGAVIAVHRKRAVTLGDVAAAAGVSRMTVSRALGVDAQSVATKTRAAIEHYADELGYIPNLTASSLSRRKSGLIGIVVSTIRTPTFSQTIDAIRLRLEQEGYHIFVGDTDYSPVKERELVRRMLGRQIDGLIVASAAGTSDVANWAGDTGVPVVRIWDLPPTSTATAVGFDNRAAGRAVARHFMDCAYQSPAFVGPEDSDNALLRPRESERWLGFCEEYNNIGGINPKLIVVKNSLDFAGGEEGIKSLLANPKRIDAAFFTYDVCAAGAVFECQRRAINIPQDLGICGFGGLPIAAAIHPQLTTIQLPLRRIGVEAAQWLIQMLAGGNVASQSLDLGFSLVCGGTTQGYSNT